MLAYQVENIGLRTLSLCHYSPQKTVKHIEEAIMKQITVFSMVSKFARIKKKKVIAKEMPKGKEFKMYPSNLSCVSIGEKSIQTKEVSRRLEQRN